MCPTGSYDVAIVGAGPAGLAAAIRLSQVSVPPELLAHWSLPSPHPPIPLPEPCELQPAQRYATLGATYAKDPAPGERATGADVP